MGRECSRMGTRMFVLFLNANGREWDANVCFFFEREWTRMGTRMFANVGCVGAGLVPALYACPPDPMPAPVNVSIRVHSRSKKSAPIRVPKNLRGQRLNSRPFAQTFAPIRVPKNLRPSAFQKIRAVNV
jgi:hypothetical protein